MSDGLSATVEGSAPSRAALLLVRCAITPGMPFFLHRQPRRVVGRSVAEVNLRMRILNRDTSVREGDLTAGLMGRAAEWPVE